MIFFFCKKSLMSHHIKSLALKILIGFFRTFFLSFPFCILAILYWKSTRIKQKYFKLFENKNLDFFLLVFLRFFIFYEKIQANKICKLNQLESIRITSFRYAQFKLLMQMAMNKRDDLRLKIGKATLNKDH